ncbi:hypothetical protein DERP_007761 [Dermatophagoides pteronyssinus]|uniref:Uncharacterized protein n=1 Tax=Dermatophagoides pteronyssinus TaxID=6956 RepID=A0ABQ8JL76_DERPT|nr:hypothetical protein DERP_007761 [Dermatophagoides pteronyssinus]
MIVGYNELCDCRLTSSESRSDDPRPDDIEVADDEPCIFNEDKFSSNGLGVVCCAVATAVDKEVVEISPIEMSDGSCDDSREILFTEIVSNAEFDDDDDEVEDTECSSNDERVLCGADDFVDCGGVDDLPAMIRYG